MYNEDKKLITDIRRNKEPEKNLAAFADAVKRVDFEYACQKFTLNYFTVKEIIDDNEISDDPYVYESIMTINKLVGKYICGKDCQVDAADEVLINGVRNKITEKMKVLTAYTDAFETYEYILNRLEYGFDENMSPEIDEYFDEYDAQNFANQLFSYIFADQDKVVVNSKIQSVVEQLPVRMTKNKFYDILEQTLLIYNGNEKGALNEFVESIEATALLVTPENFETEYSDLYKAYLELKEADYTNLDYDGYRRLSTVLDGSASFINSVVTNYLMIIELVNDLYSMLLCISQKNDIDEKCKKAVDVISLIYHAMEDEKDIPGDAYDLLIDIEGVQEETGEHKMLLEAAIYDIVSANQKNLTAYGLEKDYAVIDKLDKLLSGSMFVDIENMNLYDVSSADTEYIVLLKDKLINEFSELFGKNSRVENRAVMAKVFSNIPVFFNSQQEIKDYIENSLVHCNNRSEIMACCMVLKDMMEDVQ